MSERSAQVYWIFDESCHDPENSGYVGVSFDHKSRFSFHLRKKRVPQNAQVKVLFEGSRFECFKMENKLRPVKSMGWNSAVGGVQGWRDGFHHSDETKQLMKKAWTPERRERSSKWKAEHNRSLTGQKRPKQSEAMRGEINPTFGTKRPQHVVEAIKSSLRGKLAHNRQELYCVGCHQRCSFSIMNKYHNKCFKAWIAGQETLT